MCVCVQATSFGAVLGVIFNSWLRGWLWVNALPASVANVHDRHVVVNHMSYITQLHVKHLTFHPVTSTVCMCAGYVIWRLVGCGAGHLVERVAMGERPACICGTHPAPTGDDGVHSHAQGMKV